VNEKRKKKTTRVHHFIKGVRFAARGGFSLAAPHDGQKNGEKRGIKKETSAFSDEKRKSKRKCSTNLGGEVKPIYLNYEERVPGENKPVLSELHPMRDWVTNFGG